MTTIIITIVLTTIMTTRTKRGLAFNSGGGACGLGGDDGGI